MEILVRASTRMLESNPPGAQDTPQGTRHVNTAASRGERPAWQTMRSTDIASAHSARSSVRRSRSGRQQSQVSPEDRRNGLAHATPTHRRSRGDQRESHHRNQHGQGHLSSAGGPPVVATRRATRRLPFLLLPSCFLPSCASFGGSTRREHRRLPRKRSTLEYHKLCTFASIVPNK
jgi:hypothetical protein